MDKFCRDCKHYRANKNSRPDCNLDQCMKYSTRAVSLVTGETILHPSYCENQRANDAGCGLAAKGFEPKTFVIASLDFVPGWWNNDTGWVHDRGEATEFTAVERKTLDLPMGGEWNEVAA